MKNYATVLAEEMRPGIIDEARPRIIDEARPRIIADNIVTVFEARFGPHAGVRERVADTQDVDALRDLLVRVSRAATVEDTGLM